MRIYLAAAIIFFAVFACKNKKTTSGDKPAEENEFFEAYSEMKLPFAIADTNIKNMTDTNTISYTVFTQFIPDTIFNEPFGKDRKLAIHPIGRFEQKGKESYFVTLVNGKSHSAVYLSVYDKNKFAVGMPLVVSNDDDKVTTASIDKKLTIVVNDDWSVNNELYYKRTIYAYNNVGIFTTVLTETNEERSSEAQVPNPLDTFPKKYKYSGDYVKGNKNFVSVRDGRLPDEYRFFVHFINDNNGEPCGGDLKGEFKLMSEKQGVYSGTGDPCMLDFDFSGNQVKIKETGGCGNYRGIKCFFNDTYTKKKEPKPVVKKKQSI